MIKKIFIYRNLSLFDEVRKLLLEIQNLYSNEFLVTDKSSLQDIVAKVNDDYRVLLQTRKSWSSIRTDDVLLSALRDELKRLKKTAVLTGYKTHHKKTPKQCSGVIS